MSEHTPEPWEYFEEIHEAGKLRIYCSVARKAGGKSPEDNILRISGEDAESTVRRIVACVNACAGISTEELERGVVKEAIDMVDRLSREITALPTDCSGQNCAACANPCEEYLEHLR